jgi:Na+/melibiose symporter-like transporter
MFGELNSEAMTSLVVAIVLMLIIIAPMYCCQVSNEEYEKIVAKMKENKRKLILKGMHASVRAKQN